MQDHLDHQDQLEIQDHKDPKVRLVKLALEEHLEIEDLKDKLVLKGIEVHQDLAVKLVSLAFLDRRVSTSCLTH